MAKQHNARKKQAVIQLNRTMPGTGARKSSTGGALRLCRGA